MLYKLRLKLANILLGEKMEWNWEGKIKDTPYARLCKKISEMRDIDLPQANRIQANIYQKLWLERTIEVTKMHRALTRKNRQIAHLKKQLEEERKRKN